MIKGNGSSFPEKREGSMEMGRIKRGLVILTLMMGVVLQAETPTRENVTRLYVATFNRAPDAAGLAYWVKDSGLQLEQIAQSFFEQPETKRKYPPGTPAKTFIETVYRNLFNRDPDPSGRNYWEKELQSGRIAKPVFILAVINGAQDTAAGRDKTILENKKEVGLYFSFYGYNDTDFAQSIMKSVGETHNTVEDAEKTLYVRSGTSTKDVCVIDFLYNDGSDVTFCYPGIEKDICSMLGDRDEESRWYGFSVKNDCLGLGYPPESKSENDGAVYYYMDGLFKGVDEPSPLPAKDPDAIILSLVTEMGDVVFRDTLVPKRPGKVRLTALPNANVKVEVQTASGRRSITPTEISTDDYTVSFKVPADIVEGNLSIEGDGFHSTSLPYAVKELQSPYLTGISPDTSEVGEAVTLSGKYLPNGRATVVFQGQSGDLNRSVTVADNRVSFAVPQGAASGSVYIQIGEKESNRLYLSVKRSVKAHVEPDAALKIDANELSFVVGLEEFPLDADYNVTLPAENGRMQYLNALVTQEGGESAVLYSAVLLPDAKSVTLDANSTAVAWIFIGMGAGVTTPKDQLKALYKRVASNEEVQEFANYLAALQRDDFDAWVALNDETLKSKFQEALKSVIQASSAPTANAIQARGLENPNAVLITQDPQNDNIYVNDYRYPRLGMGEKLNDGTVYVVNDTRLYLCIEARDKKKGDIVNGYKRMASALDKSKSLIGPKGWAITEISSTAKLDLKGTDSQIRIVTGGSLGKTEYAGLAKGLRARTFLEGAIVPPLNSLVSFTVGKVIDKGFNGKSLGKRVVTALSDIYGTSFWTDFLEKVSADRLTSTGDYVKQFITDPVTQEINDCFLHNFDLTKGKCEQVVKGVLELAGVGDMTDAGKKFMAMLAKNAAKKVFKKGLKTVPYYGQIIAVSEWVYDSIGYIADTGTATETLWDIHYYPKEINVDVDFPLEVADVAPTCVAIDPSKVTQAFVVKGEGLAGSGATAPEVSIGSGDDKNRATDITTADDGTDLVAAFSVDDLMAEGSRSSFMFINHLGQHIMYEKPIRMVSTEDEKVYFDSIIPERAMLGQTVTLKGCGWVPLNDVKVYFNSTEDKEIEAQIVSKTIDTIKVKVPQNAQSGLVYVKAGQKKTYGRYFEVIPFGIFSMDEEALEDGTRFTLSGQGLANVAHVYFTDHTGNRIEGTFDNANDSSMHVKTPDGLEVGPVTVQVELSDGMQSNRLTVKKVPKEPVANPTSGVIGDGLTVSLSQEEGADIYYSLDAGTERKYSAPVKLSLDDLTNTDLTLYAFARKTVDGVNYDSDKAEFYYYPCEEDKELKDGECVEKDTNNTLTSCPMTYDASLDKDDYNSYKINVIDANSYTECDYYESGQLKEEMSVTDGELNGLDKQYYESGQLLSEDPYTNGFENGIEKQYYESGQLAYEKPFVHGVLTGTIKVYTESGCLSQESYYENGNEISNRYYSCD